MEWSRTNLKLVTDKIGDGLHGTPKYSDSGKIPFINGNNLKTGRISLDSKTKYVEKDEHERHLKDLGDRTVLLSINGTIGNVAQYRGEKVVLGKSACYLNCNDKIEPKYLAYLLRDRIFQNHINQTATGTTIKNVSLALVRNYEFENPPPKDQKAIAHILGTLDDKIELNQKINETLEEIAKAIFKSWFVDFAPVRAKMEGRPTGLPDDVSDLFPDELVESEIGEIPKGWEVKTVDNLFDISIGRTPPRKETHWFSESELDIPWVSIKDMGDAGTFITKTSEFLTSDAVSTHRMRLLPAWSILVSFKLTVGRVSITTCDMTTNEAIAHFPKSEPFPFQAYTYFYLKSFNYELLGSTSSIATAVNSKIIKAIPILSTNIELMQKFDSIVMPILEKIQLASKENQVLSELRDTLLPKLISGELQIPDAEKFLEEAGI